MKHVVTNREIGRDEAIKLMNEHKMGKVISCNLHQMMMDADVKELEKLYEFLIKGRKSDVLVIVNLHAFDLEEIPATLGPNDKEEYKVAVNKIYYAIKTQCDQVV